MQILLKILQMFLLLDGGKVSENVKGKMQGLNIKISSIKSVLSSDWSNITQSGKKNTVYVMIIMRGKSGQ